LEGILRVRVDEIKIESNFRKIFDIYDLKVSMEERGLIEPIVITQNMVLVAGERRLRAAKELNWEFIEAHMRDYSSEQDIKTDQIYENIKRHAFTPSEQAEALAYLKKNRKIVVRKQEGDKTKWEQICDLTGLCRSEAQKWAYVGERMSDYMAEKLNTKEISPKMASLICRFKNHDEQDKLIKLAIESNMTTDQMKNYLKDCVDKKIESISPSIDNIRLDKWQKRFLNNIKKLESDYLKWISLTSSKKHLKDESVVDAIKSFYFNIKDQVESN
jgi:ParB family chromosome partitioning protein